MYQHLKGEEREKALCELRLEKDEVTHMMMRCQARVMHIESIIIEMGADVPKEEDITQEERSRLLGEKLGAVHVG